VVLNVLDPKKNIALDLKPNKSGSDQVFDFFQFVIFENLIKFSCEVVLGIEVWSWRQNKGEKRFRGEKKRDGLYQGERIEI